MGYPDLGFIGTGIMGRAMVEHLLAHQAVTVYNRTRAKTQGLEELGANLVSTPREVGQQASLIFIMVTDDAALQSVMYGDEGLLAGLTPGSTIVDHSTVSVDLTRRLAREVGQIGATWCDAPVTGGDVGARDATLTIMVGGPASTFEMIAPYLQRLGRRIVYVGDVGQGQALKVVSNLVSALNLMAAAEGLRLGIEAGLSIEAMDAVMSHGSAQSFEVSKMVDRFGRQDYKPGFSVANRFKDLGLARELARSLGHSIPLADQGYKLYAEHVARGYQSLDESSYILRWSTHDD